jgi:PPOX class probable F420-dependent enzyme
MNPSDARTMDNELGGLAGHKYLNLETYRRSGLAVRTPVWFAQEDNTIFVRTVDDSGKVKRILNNPRVRIAPCDSRGALLGTWLEANARLASMEEVRKADELLGRKYGELERGFDLISSLRGDLWAVIRLDLRPLSGLQERG